MKDIFLVRHCQAQGQEPDAPLTEAGERQALEMASFLADQNIELLVSSPYLRALHTVRPLAEQLSLSVEQDSRLTERVLSSQPMSDWYAKLKLTFEQPDLAFKGGESTNEAMHRAREAIAALLPRKETRILLVTHGNLLALLLKSYQPNIGFQDWENLTNPDVYHLRLSADGQMIHLHRIWEG
jgi:2,3-bisphosphoglycerate-dependent phosphoglycerate mutase